ncbi:MAG: hypothetical protein L0229_30565 [Blastocatellia bacterium]|nr:hypothetical protein [Blastocatellia bacterium]
MTTNVKDPSLHGGKEMNFCDVCSSPSVHRKSIFAEPYHYTESGLPNVYLVNVDVYYCEQCGIEVASIPHPRELHLLIVTDILVKPSAMTGDELRFIRKTLMMQPEEFADLLAVETQTILDWQNAKALNRQSDSLVRFIFAKLLGQKGELEEDVDIPVPAQITEDDWATTRREIAELAEVNTSLGIPEMEWKLSSGEAS